jgi:hypothetical protein
LLSAAHAAEGIGEPFTQLFQPNHSPEGENQVAKNRDIEEKKIKRELPFELTTGDYAKKCKEAATLSAEVGEMKKTFADLKAEWKGKIEVRQSELNQLLRAVKEGKENRLVDCLERKDFTKFVVEYVYAGKVLLTRPLDKWETQQNLFNDGVKPKQKKEKKPNVLPKVDRATNKPTGVEEQA